MVSWFQIWGCIQVGWRLVAWAAERPSAHVLKLNRIVGNMRAGRGFELGTARIDADAKLLQPDELHPTEQGMETLMAAVALCLHSAKLAAIEDFELDLDPFAPDEG